ncbi:MAG: alpha/beta hydrolase family esterase [Microthrixaceae bacterium]
MRHRLLPALIVLVVAAACSSSATDADPDRTTTSTTLAGNPNAAADGEVASADPTPSSGCGATSATPVSLERRTIPALDRWYLLTVPAAHDGNAPLPVVLDFHGLSEGADVHTRTSGLSPYAEAHDFIAVFPNGTGTPVHWNVSLDRKTNEDLVFIDALLDDLESSLCVDTSRVYATGLSNGALMSSVLACSMSDRFAAVAPVAGINEPDGCAPTRPMPVLAFHGTQDPILLFNGGVGSRLGSVLGGGPPDTTPLPEPDLTGKGYPANAAAWAARNGCAKDFTDTEPTATVIQRTWDCPAEAAVVFDILVGGGHSWPGSEFTKSIEAIVGPTDMSIDGTDRIWRFFQRFARPPA